MNVPVRRMTDGVTDYFPMSVLDAVFLNRSIEVKNTIGGLPKGAVVNKNTSLQTLFDRILTTVGPDYQALIANKVDKDGDKGLSTCDFTVAYRTKVEQALTEHQDISGKVDKVEGKRLSTNDLTDALLLKLNNAITEHQDISGKVDKVTGKGLSANDYTTGEKIKLSMLQNYDDTYIRTQLLNKLGRDEVIKTISRTSEYPIQSRILYPVFQDILARLGNIEALLESVWLDTTVKTDNEVQDVPSVTSDVIDININDIWEITTVKTNAEVKDVPETDSEILYLSTLTD